MRRMTLLVAAVLGLVSARADANQCAAVADQSAYEVFSLRNQMIVLAYKCKRESDYDKQFVIRFQPALQANDRAVTAYFRRLYGGAAQNRKDSFTTNLVNVLSQTANTQGGEYCARAGLLINEMSALRSMDELAAYAAVKDMAPAGTSMCPAGGAAARRR